MNVICLVEGRSVSAACRAVEEAVRSAHGAAPPLAGAAAVFVYSLMGENEIPASVVERLATLPAGRYGVVIIGDFPELPPNNPEHVARLRHAVGRGVALLRPLFLPSPPRADLYRRLTSAWVQGAEVMEEDGSAQEATPMATRPQGQSTASRQLPGLPPHRTISNRAGHIIGLEFIDQHPFPRSTLDVSPTQAQLARFAQHLRDLDALRYVALPFAPPDYVSRLPKWLEAVDLRGSPLGDEVSRIAQFEALSWINLGATRIERVPDVLRRIPNLDTVLLYKNTIGSVPDWLFRMRIRRISFYRNQIADIVFPNVCPTNLRAFNVGANPLYHDAFGRDWGICLPLVEELGLRGINLPGIPKWVQQLKHLKVMDVSNNPFDLASDPEWARCVVRGVSFIGMPLWPALTEPVG